MAASQKPLVISQVALSCGKKRRQGVIAATIEHSVVIAMIKGLGKPWDSEQSIVGKASRKKLYLSSKPTDKS